MTELEMERKAMLEVAKKQAIKARSELRILAIFASNFDYLSDIQIQAEKMVEELKIFISGE